MNKDYSQKFELNGRTYVIRKILINILINIFLKAPILINKQRRNISKYVQSENLGIFFLAIKKNRNFTVVAH